MTRINEMRRRLINAGVAPSAVARIIFREEQRNEAAAAPLRTHCSVCGKEVKSFRLEPGTGRCTECQP